MIGAIIGLVIRLTGVLGQPRQWEYLSVTLAGLGYTMLLVLTGLLVSTVTGPRARIRIGENWILGLVQTLIVGFLIAVLP